MSGAQPACDNAAVLSRILARVVSNLDDHARTFWCQMMDTLALRTEAGDVQYSVSIAPYLPWHAEDAYALHEPRLRDPQISHLCPRCGGLAKRKRKRQRRRRTEFSWVEDEDDDLDDEAGSTQRLAIASFEAYICDVLGEAGKNEFVRERFYGGAPLNSRYLLAKFGTGLGMSQEELQLRQADMFDMQEDPAAMSDDDYMSGLSDVDSIHRSDNGAFE